MTQRLIGVANPHPDPIPSPTPNPTPNPNQVTKLLIGNKDDVKGAKVVDPEQAREFAAEHNMLFMEASAMRATNVSAAFRLLVAEVMHQADTLASQVSEQV